MKTKDEALTMAIEALKDADKGYAVIGEYDELIQTCKEALEQPAQEPVAWIYEWEDEKAAKLTFHPDSKAKVIPLYTHPAPAIVQEPLASLVFYDDGSIEALSHDGTISRLMTKEQRKWHNPIPLYTHSAPSWQGLSDDEIDKAWNEISKYGISSAGVDFTTRFARAIEQALRNKNE